MMRFHRLAAALLGAVLCAHLIAQPVSAEEKQSSFKARRSLGVLFIGGSLVLAKQGFSFRDEADELYAKYKKAGSPEEADRLYTRTNNRDVKSQVSWALAAAFVLSGSRLLLSKDGGSSRIAKVDRVAPGFLLEPQLQPRRIGVQLKRRFF
ncbi:uncharacterized protein METZ01_LOCUS324896 [marine metagenome]|uniref:Uncharacterized protein n=1 Tax=marine metagenome TaxID=408172 RepID=A0A382PJ89_9ZZZZ